MGLDAHVNCNCFERGLLPAPPDPSWKVKVFEDGSRGIDERGRPLEELLDFDRWNLNACDHEDGVVVHHRIGNIALVGNLRRALEPLRVQIPTIMNEVIQDAVHDGEIRLDHIPWLRAELTVTSRWSFEDARDEERLRYFERQMRDLVEAAERHRHPIVF